MNEAQWVALHVIVCKHDLLNRLALQRQSLTVTNSSNSSRGIPANISETAGLQLEAHPNHYG